MKLRSHIVLIGFSGSGKSTVGRLLAKKLGCSFVDIDKRVEKEAGETILRVFETAGEKAFRKLESAMIKKHISKRLNPKVIALGGGAFETESSQKIISENGISVWLKCSAHEIHKRLINQSDRPKLANKNAAVSSRELKLRIGRLLQKRKGNYANADLRITTSNKAPNRVMLEIVSKLRDTHACS